MCSDTLTEWHPRSLAARKNHSAQKSRWQWWFVAQMDHLGFGFGFGGDQTVSLRHDLPANRCACVYETDSVALGPNRLTWCPIARAFAMSHGISCLCNKKTQFLTSKICISHHFVNYTKWSSKVWSANRRKPCYSLLLRFKSRINSLYVCPLAPNRIMLSTA